MFTQAMLNNKTHNSKANVQAEYGLGLSFKRLIAFFQLNTFFTFILGAIIAEH